MALALAGWSAMAKPFVAEGYVTAAPSPYDLYANYVLRSDPDGRIVVALNDPRGLILIQPNCRLRILGDPARDRIVDDLAVIVVNEVQSAGWSQPESRLCPPSIASWAGCGSSLYPSLAEEALPRGPTFNTGPPAPADSDGDGVPDYLDAFPNDPSETTDTDRDGIGNNADLDDDNDGMPDSYELAHGLNPLVNDAARDLDRDGMNNLDEYLAGTDAKDPESILRIDTLRIVRSTVSLVFRSVPGRYYVVYASKIPDSKFEPVGDPFEAREKQTTLAVPLEPRLATQFYRVQVLSP